MKKCFFDLVLATRNQHKVQEIKRLLKGAGIKLKSLADLPPVQPVKENGSTLAANAIKKALSITKKFGCNALADDSGLFVPALKGKPGVKSARYAGPGCDYPANNQKLLKAMKKMRGQSRRAYFATVMALTLPAQKPIIRIGKIRGRITLEPRGAKGFGYDPVFQAQGHHRTFAEMKPKEKNRISHRALAADKIARVIKNILIKNLANKR